MKHRLRVGVLSTIFVLFVLPVLISQLFTPDGRSFHGVKLEDTQYLEISFQNKAQNIALGGMLFVPQGEGPFPAVVIFIINAVERRRLHSTALIIKVSRLNSCLFFELAREVKLTHSHVLRQFRKRYGITPTTFQILTRHTD